MKRRGYLIRGPRGHLRDVSAIVAGVVAFGLAWALVGARWAA